MYQALWVSSSPQTNSVERNSSARLLVVSFSGYTEANMVLIATDGTFLFSVPGSVYWISRRYNIPILTIVLNNQGWNAPRKSMLLVHPEGEGSKVSNKELNISFAPTPDYAGIAKAAAGGDLFAARAGTVDELEKVLEEAVKTVLGGMSAVVDAHLDGPLGKYAGPK